MEIEHEVDHVAEHGNAGLRTHKQASLYISIHQDDAKILTLQLCPC
jgi:hypothetical protein